jgi:acetyl esterase
MCSALYIPETSRPVPVMIYMHGGGWVLGNYTGVDELVRALVNRSGCAILSIDYSLAPECKHPAALEDVDRALGWVVANGDRWGLNSKCLAVGGDSSGANLAAAASLLYQHRGGPTLTFQLLVYPPLDHNYDNGSYRRYGDGMWSALSRADLIWFHNHYVSQPEELDSPYVSPLQAESLAHMPRTLLICAEVDPLLDESVEYARRLEAAGVPVELKLYSGMFHGFWRMRGMLKEARQAIDYAATKMNEAMMLPLMVHKT